MHDLNAKHIVILMVIGYIFRALAHQNRIKETSTVNNTWLATKVSNKAITTSLCLEYIIAHGLPRGTNSDTGSYVWLRVIVVVVHCEKCIWKLVRRKLYVRGHDNSCYENTIGSNKQPGS